MTALFFIQLSAQVSAADSLGCVSGLNSYLNLSFAAPVVQGSFASGYQHLFNIYKPAGMNSDFSGIAICNSTDSTATKNLSYWINPNPPSGNVSGYVKADSSLGTTGVTYYLFFNNSSASFPSLSSGNNTFPLFEECNGDRLNATIWGNTTNTFIENGECTIKSDGTATFYRMQSIEGFGFNTSMTGSYGASAPSTGNRYAGFASLADGGPSGVFWLLATEGVNNMIHYYESGSSAQIAGTTLWNDSTWTNIRNGTHNVILLNHSLNDTQASTTSTVRFAAVAAQTGNKDMAAKWLFVSNTTFPGASYNNTTTYQASSGASVTAPQFSQESQSKANSTRYSPSNNFGFSVNISGNSSALSLAMIEANFSGTLTNYTNATGLQNTTGYIYWVNFTQAQTKGAANYTLRYIANMTDGTVNASSSVIYNIDKNASNPVQILLNATADANVSYTYPAAVNATALALFSSSGTLAFYRDSGTAIAGNQENVRLANNSYGYKANMTGNANYSDNSTGETFYALVNKGTPTLVLQSGGNATYPDQIIANCTATGIVDDVPCKLYRNSSNITGENNTAIRINAATFWNYSSNTSETGNYSSTQSWIAVQVSQASVNVTVGTAGNVTYPNSVTVNCTSTRALNDEAPACGLFRNDTNVTGQNNTAVQLGAGIWIFKTNTTGTENYTANTGTASIAINVAQNSTNPLDMYFNATKNANRTVNMTQIIFVMGNMTFDNSTNSTTYGNASLYRNGSLVGNPVSQNLSAGVYNYTVNTSGNANYSANSTGAWFFLTVQDVTDPNIFNITTSVTYPIVLLAVDQPNYFHKFNATVDDGSNVSVALFELDGINYTATVRRQITGYTAEFSVNFTGISFGTHYYRWLSNDTTGRWAASSNTSFDINGVSTTTGGGGAGQQQFTPTCGNLVCEIGESSLSCPKDCGITGQFIANPPRFTYNLFRGQNITDSFFVESNGTQTINLTLTKVGFDESYGWAELQTNTLEIANLTSISLRISVPATAENGNYTFNITLATSGMKRSIPVYIEVGDKTAVKEALNLLQKQWCMNDGSCYQYGSIAVFVAILLGGSAVIYFIFRWYKTSKSPKEQL